MDSRTNITEDNVGWLLLFYFKTSQMILSCRTLLYMLRWKENGAWSLETPVLVLLNKTRHDSPAWRTTFSGSNWLLHDIISLSHLCSTVMRGGVWGAKAWINMVLHYDQTSQLWSHPSKGNFSQSPVASSGVTLQSWAVLPWSFESEEASCQQPFQTAQTCWCFSS